MVRVRPLGADGTRCPYALRTSLNRSPMQVVLLDSAGSRCGASSGRGSFGVVFLAYDPRLRRQVALKVPRPEVLLTAEMRRRFERKARRGRARPSQPRTGFRRGRGRVDRLHRVGVLSRADAGRLARGMAGTRAASVWPRGSCSILRGDRARPQPGRVAPRPEAGQRHHGAGSQQVRPSAATKTGSTAFPA